MAGGPASELSRGGMRTKVEAGKIAASGGTHMVIADGREKNPLRTILQGGRCTWFLSGSNPVAARKAWIAGSLEPRGVLVVDAGAAVPCKAARAFCRSASPDCRAASGAGTR